MPNYVTIELRRSRNKQFYAVILAANGEPLFTTETVKRRATLKRTLNRMVQNLAGGRVLFKDTTAK